MKLTSITGPNGPTPAALLTNGRMVDLAAASAAGMIEGDPVLDIIQILTLDSSIHLSTRSFIDRLEAGEPGLVDKLNELGALSNAADAVYAPILRPRVIISSGMAYKNRTQPGAALPPAPTAFMKSPSTVNAHGQPLVLPAHDPDMMDYECEFSCVIGRSFHNVAPEEALAHVAGYTMVNDLGSRSHTAEWIDATKSGDPLEAARTYLLRIFDKQLPGTCPLGPVIVTADEYGDPGDAYIETRLNGQVMQSAHASDLVFPLAYTLSYFSRWFRFEPGDVITTGSPPGFAYSQNPPRYLRPGDVIEVWSPKIGALANPVVAANE